MISASICRRVGGLRRSRSHIFPSAKRCWCRSANDESLQFPSFLSRTFFKHVNWKMTAWQRFLTSKLNYENDTHSFNSAITKKLQKTQKSLQWRTTNRILGVNSLHPNISKHILHTVLYTFPKVLTRRICLTIKSFFSWWSFPLFSWP